MLGPSQAKLHAPTWVNAAEERLADFAMEGSTNYLELPVWISKPVSMSQIKHLVGQFNRDRFSMEDNSTFLLQIILAPNIMIASEIMDFYAHIRQLADFS